MKATLKSPGGRTAEAGCSLLISRLARISGYRFGRSLAGLDMRGHEFAILHRLAEAGPVHQQELSRVLRVHPSNLVALLDQLEDSGMIARRRDRADRRRLVVGLTAAGARRLGRAEQAVAEAERELLAPLSAAEQRELRRYLQRLSEHACRPEGGRC